MEYPFYPCVGPDDNLNPPEPIESDEPTAEAEARAEDFWNERGMSEKFFNRFPEKVREPKNAREFLFGIGN